MQASGPRPPVRSSSVSWTFSVMKSMVSAPARLARHRQPRRDPIDRDHPGRAEQERRPNRELSNRSRAPHGDDVAGAQLAVLGGHVAGRKDVREEQPLFVGDVRRQPQRADVGERHPDVFGLSAGEPAVQMRVAEQPGAAGAVQGFERAGVRVRVVAERPQVARRHERSARRRWRTARPRDRPPPGSSRRSRSSTTSPRNSWPRMSPRFIPGMKPP